MTTIKQHELVVSSYTERLILASEPKAPLWNRESLLYKKPARWNYIDACMIRALTMLYDVSGDSRLTEYAIGFTNAYVESDGSIPTMKAADFNLDNINGGKNLIRLYRETSDERYRLAFDKLYVEQLAHQPRLQCGSFIHKAIYRGQMWLDGAYMALPFLVEYGLMTDRTELISDALAQLKNIRALMRDPDTGLYYHGYDESRTEKWADKKTGLSPNFWLRSIGWLCAGLADICELLPEDSSCRDMLGELLEALTRYQTDSGMLLQLPTRAELNGNYPEASGTLLFAYSALRASRLGITGSSIRSAGERALARVAEDFIRYDEKIPVMSSICLTAGLGGSPYRDGSAEYYLGERVTENDAKGIAPYLMAYTELVRS